FPWGELGEYQNLTALLSAPISIEPLPHDLKSEIRTIFTKILQGNEVDYPIVASELQIIEPFIDSIKAPVVEPIPEPIPQKIVTPEVTEKKETAFQIKFRSPDPKELSMLKKTEPVTIASKPTPVVARTEKEIHFRDNYTVVKKPGVFVSRTEATLNNKEVIQTAVKDDRTTQNKVSSGFLEKPDLKIKNDSPIVIEEARPLMVKDAVPFKSRLIPNSSINVKDFLKKDESISRVKEIDNINAKDLKDVQSKPGEPVTNKTEIKINTNEPLKETKAINPSVDNNNLGFQNKSAVPGTSNSDNVLKTNQERKELSKSSPFIEKDIQAPECKPVAPVINKTEINININEPPKETKTINPFVDNYNRNFQNKSAVPLTSKPDIIIKTNGTPKELSKSSPFIEKDEKLIQSNPVSTVVEKFDIKIKTNEPPKELIKKNPIIGQDVKTPESKPVVPVDEKPGIKIGTNELSQEVKTITPLVEKVEKKTEITSTIPIVKESEIKINANELSELKVEINPAVSKVDNKFQRIKSPVDKTNLKIRETSFFEGETKPAVSKIEDKLSIPDAKADVEKVIEVNKLKESINIDEILTKIEEINPDTLIGGLSYDAEIKKLEKASKRKILVAAALFAVLIVSGIFVYQNLQPNPVKAAGEIKNPEKLMVNAQANFVLQNDPEEVTATGEVKGTVENPTQELKKSDAKISLPPLPENLSKEESTYFALNEKSDLINTPIKENNLTAAAKTENIAPPKEDKKIEEEPTIFVAVEEMPELIGGIKGLQSKIVYPEIAKRVGIEGKVIVQAIVDESGNVISVNTLKGIGSGCDEVAMDAVRNSKFTPGKQRGKTVKTQITIPIVFKK
ncbi:MAG: TonB family protein, partial [Ignavibacteria bacterium]|nr:TonB family protein [Ignavibacteria bacterium]